MMDRKERERLVALSRVKDKGLPRRDAAEGPGVSLRQVQRLYRRYRRERDRRL
jgi:transposase